MPPHIHLLRHGQGYHQLEPTSKNQNIHDPHLTPEGIEKCKGFRKANQPRLNFRPDLICASPLRRTIQTARYCFTPEAPILLLPYAQEATDLPSDTGSPREVIEAEFGPLVDASMVEEGWNSNKGIYAPSPEALGKRARALRAWLYERSEKEVVVVGHGNFWHWLTGEIDAEGNQTSKLLRSLGFVMLRC